MSTTSLGAGAAAISVGLILMFVSSLVPNPKVVAEASSLVKCPSCAEMIQVEAKKCRFCGEELLQKGGAGAA
jgi:hypothetical protein